MGSGLSAFRLQLPDGIAAGDLFTVSTAIVDGRSGENCSVSGVTARYL
jgi:hypothetical protein